ncbi:MAG: hypothetical protein ACR2IV_05475 [Bryobacteraceae bacterium]
MSTNISGARIRQLSDNAGFYNPSWYSTIQTAVLDSKRGAKLHARTFRSNDDLSSVGVDALSPQRANYSTSQLR